MSPDGVLVVDKPAGPTSHDVVRRVRAILGMRRIGHTGTLDPFATGVLGLCVGRATRLAQHLSAADKVYRGEVRFGFATSTDDLEGEPLGEPQTVMVDRDRLAAACAQLTGRIAQQPPRYSAKRIAGRRMHELARRGAQVEPRPVMVTIHRIEIVHVEADRAQVEVSCSSGTYVRAIARDLGEMLGCGGHLASLRRLRSGAFDLGQAVALDELDRATAGDAIVPLRGLLTDWPVVAVGEDGVEALRHGRDIPLEGVTARPDEGRVRILDPSGDLVALGSVRPGLEAPGLSVPPVLHPDTVLIDAAGRREISREGSAE